MAQKKVTNAYKDDLDLNLCYSPTKAFDDDKGIEEVQIIHPHSSKVFSCNYCRRKFFSSQALGGHQNAHKRERTIAKRAMRIGYLSDNGHRQVSLASLPLNGLTSSQVATSRPSIPIQAHHGNMMMVINTPHSEAMRGAPASVFEGQNGYFVGDVPVFNTVPFWPGSFRHSIINDNNNGFNNHCSSQNYESFPDLTLKL